MMQQLVDSLSERAASQRSMDALNPSADNPDRDPFVPCTEELYPLRRRAERLSYMVWAVISNDNRELQKAMEAASTGDRLRLAVLRLRELREQLK